MARSQWFTIAYIAVITVLLCIAQLSARPYENANMFRALRSFNGNAAFRALKRNSDGMSHEGLPWKTMERRIGAVEPRSQNSDEKLTDEQLVWFLENAGRRK